MRQKSHGGAKTMLIVVVLALLLILFSSAALGGEANQTGSASGLENGRAAKGPQPQGAARGIERLIAASGGEAQVTRNEATGVAGFVRFPRGRALPAVASASAEAAGDSFFSAYGEAFGIENAAELTLIGRENDRYGVKHLTYRQTYNGVDVFAGILRVHVERGNKITAVNGVFVPGIAVDTTAQVGAEQAAEVAQATVLAAPPEGVAGLAAADVTVTSSKLYVYRDGLLQGVPGRDYLVYEVQLLAGTARESLYVDAHTGAIVNRISETHDALYRRLYEQNTSNQVWQEGDLFPGGLNQDQQNIVNASGDSYYFFFNAFGSDSYNGIGAEMRSVNNDPRINCPNANWNGVTTNYCNGVTADDVVAHEWGHAYTDYTSDLIYQWQSGALNESYSDIWGETVDMLNGAGTDSPAPVRSDSCSIYTTALPRLTVNSPASIAGDYAAGAASFGPQLTSTGVTGNLVLGDDGAGASATDACEPLVNGADIAGNVALVDRGTCAFTIKVKNAQDAGATAVVVADNVPGPVAGMGGADATITIPSVRVTLDTGNTLKGELANGVNVTLLDAGGAREDSYRWLMGEDATAFGSAIRDMWQPTCKSDPGKVTDDEYFCDASDGGGVHSNSGVPNHTYALLVDGGSYNGQTIAALGLTKAAHLFWQAGANYLTPSSDFADFADALEASCQDLMGVDLEGLTTGATPIGPSGEVIDAADCATVAVAIAAAELRTSPAEQCNFQPLLEPDAPELCEGTPYEAESIYFEDFEAGLGSWSLSNQGVFAGWPGYDWAQATALPGGRSGAAAFGTDPSAGNCDGGAGDVSGAMFLESGDITITNDSLLAPRMAFDHYVATEAGWDGGNLKISINGAPFVTVPPAAYTFNPYNMTLQAVAAGNTNPLAGQPGFSGTDGGSLGGSWGQSQIDLAALDVMPGDTIRLRYDMGIDGCTGVDGWYVDDVNVYACEAPQAPVCTDAYASTEVLWPANHMFRPIDILGVTDPNGDAVSITIDSIFQDEPVLAEESGNTSPDGEGIGTPTAVVRSERSGIGNGRVYTIGFTASDPFGSSCSGTVTVASPLAPRQPAVDDGAMYDSTAP